MHVNKSLANLVDMWWLSVPFCIEKMSFSYTCASSSVTGLDTDMWPTQGESESFEKIATVAGGEWWKLGAILGAPSERPVDKEANSEASWAGRSENPCFLSCPKPVHSVNFPVIWGKISILPWPGTFLTKTRLIKVSVTNNHYNPSQQSLNHITVNNAKLHSLTQIINNIGTNNSWTAVFPPTLKISHRWPSSIDVTKVTVLHSTRYHLLCKYMTNHLN